MFGQVFSGRSRRRVALAARLGLLVGALVLAAFVAIPAAAMADEIPRNSPCTKDQGCNSVPDLLIAFGVVIAIGIIYLVVEEKWDDRGSKRLEKHPAAEDQDTTNAI